MNKYIIQGKTKMDKDFFLIKDFAYLHQRNNVDIVTNLVPRREKSKDLRNSRLCQCLCYIYRSKTDGFKILFI